MQKLEIIEIHGPSVYMVQDALFVGDVYHTENLKDVFKVFQLSEEETNIPEGLKWGIWKHFKPGKTYEVIGVAYREGIETRKGEWLVIYKSLYASKDYPKGTLWGRPVNDFLGMHKSGVKRFEYIGE
jgi:hypothetical protein